jgi:hypothetical protein
MSEEHGAPAHGENHDVPSGPELQRIPRFVVGLLLLAMVIIALQGTFVEMSSPYFHVWPASDAAKVQLPPESH